MPASFVTDLHRVYLKVENIVYFYKHSGILR